MKRILVLLLSLSLLFAVVGCDNTDENADQPSDTVQTTELSEKTTEVTETHTAEPTTAPEETETSETTIETSSEESSETEQTDPAEDTIGGKYYCSTDFFTDEYRIKYPGDTPYITLNDDGSCVLLVGYFHGICEVEGTYLIEGNVINVELDLRGTPFEGTDTTGRPFMDDRFVFEIIDNDHIVIGPAPNAVYNGDCYVVRSGDSFIRE